MGLNEGLSREGLATVLDNTSPLDGYVDRGGHRPMAVSTTRVKTVLSLFDTCLQNHDPENYNHDWMDDHHVGVRMYRGVHREELELLKEVVEATYGLNIGREDLKIFTSLHTAFVEQNVDPALGSTVLYMVVWNTTGET